MRTHLVNVEEQNRSSDRLSFATDSVTSKALAAFFVTLALSIQVKKHTKIAAQSTSRRLLLLLYYVAIYRFLVRKSYGMEDCL